MPSTHEFLKKKIESLQKHQQFKDWNRNNKLSEEPLLLFHGTYHNNFEEISLDSGSDLNHFSNGLHLSNNINEVNNFYVKDLNTTDKEKSRTLDIHAKLDNFLEISEQFYENQKMKNVFLNKFKFTENVKKIINSIDELELEEENILFIEEFLKKSKQELNEDEFFYTFKIKKSEINNWFDFENECFKENMGFNFFKNIYFQNEGLVLPFFLKSEKPLYCLDPNDAKNNDLPCTSFFIFEDEINIKEEAKNTEKYLQDIYNDIKNNNDIEKLDEIFEEFKSSISNVVESGDYALELFIMCLNNYIEDEYIIENCINSFQNLILEDDFFIYYDDKDELELIQEQHQDFVEFNEFITNNLTDCLYKEYNNIKNNNFSAHYMENISVRDFLYKIGKESPELKETITNKIIPKIYDVAIFHANFEFNYLDKSFENDKTLHYLVYNSENVKYAFNKTFDPENHKMSARRIEETTDFSISDEEIDAAIKKIRKVYPYYPKIINHNYKENTIAEFNHDTEEVHLYRKNIKSEAELIKTLLHEYVIHYGLHKTLGEEGENLLLSTYEYMEKNNLLNDVIEKYPEFNLKTNEGKCRLAEEKLAFMSEKQLFKKNSFLDNICYKLKKLFHGIKEALGISHMEDKIFLTIDTINENLKIQNDFKAHHDYKNTIENKVKNNTKKKLKFN
tara:strand:- start:3945 stop:5975 length:2031 start_codon:yes stop_codon:yes gene_type:complete